MAAFSHYIPPPPPDIRAPWPKACGRAVCSKQLHKAYNTAWLRMLGDNILYFQRKQIYTVAFSRFFFSLHIHSSLLKPHLYYWIAGSNCCYEFSKVPTAWYIPTYPKMRCAFNHALYKTYFMLLCNLYNLLSGLLSETREKLFN